MSKDPRNQLIKRYREMCGELSHYKAGCVRHHRPRRCRSCYADCATSLLPPVSSADDNADALIAELDAVMVDQEVDVAVAKPATKKRVRKVIWRMFTDGVSR